MKTFLNLGCGHRYHPDWTNYDLVSHGPAVIAHDLSTGIPQHDANCGVVYHSHVLEHLRRPQALPFLRECARVLEPGGVLRIAVPDLEQICRGYLNALDRITSGDTSGAADHEWMMMELYDQAVREQSGGGMLGYLRRDTIPNEPFVLQRIGEEGREILRALRELSPRQDGFAAPGAASHSRLFDILRVLKRGFRRRVTEWLLGPGETHKLDVGRFRLAGEIHCWMYDRHSLGELMKQAGFIDPVRQAAQTSRVPNWTSFNLDTLADGTVVKPDSLYMEAVKPASQ